MKRQNYGSFADMATQHMLAPILDNLVAPVAFETDDMFIFNNELYKATTDIAVDTPITIGSSGNADYASTIAEEIDDKMNDIEVLYNQNNITVSKKGKIAIVNFNLAILSNIKAISYPIPLSNTYMMTLVRLSNNKYYSGWVAIATNGSISDTKYASTYAGDRATIPDDSVLMGAVVYTIS